MSWLGAWVVLGGWRFINFLGREFLYADTGRLKEGVGDGVIAVVAEVENGADSGGDDGFGAVDTGIVRDVAIGAFGGLSAAGAVYDGVLFGVDCGLFVVVADNRGMWTSGEEPVVSGGDDAIGFRENGADLEASAGGARGGEFGDLGELVFPREAAEGGHGLLNTMVLFRVMFVGDHKITPLSLEAPQ